MNPNLSERRLAENEVYFRECNEQLEKQLEKLNDIAAEEGKQHLIPDDSQTSFHFYCECSDENCQKRIALTLNIYISIHKYRDQFVILPEHEVIEIEKVIDKQLDYWIVKKIVPVPNTSNQLNSTPIQNV